MKALPGSVSGGSPVSSLMTCVVILIVMFACPVWVVGRVLGWFGPLQSPPDNYATTTQNGTTENPIDLLHMSGKDPADDLTRSEANQNQAEAFKTIEEGYAVKRLSEAESCDIRNDCNLYWQQSQPKQESSAGKTFMYILLGVVIGVVLIVKLLTGGK